MSEFLDNIKLVKDGPVFDRLGLIHRVRQPKSDAGAPFPTLVMLHGFQGNEDVTWVFSRSAGPGWLIVAPRAPLRADDLGYTWHHFNAGKTDPDTMAAALAKLTRFVEGLAEVYPADRNRLVLLGFSQGAAMAYAFAASQPQSPLIGLAALGGYVPGTVTLPALNGLPVLMLHGTRDETISITLARKNHADLTGAGATVTYVEDDVGHKVSAMQMRELGTWLAQRLT